MLLSNFSVNFILLAELYMNHIVHLCYYTKCIWIFFICIPTSKIIDPLVARAPPTYRCPSVIHWPLVLLCLSSAPPPRLLRRVVDEGSFDKEAKARGHDGGAHKSLNTLASRVSLTKRRPPCTGARHADQHHAASFLQCISEWHRLDICFCFIFYLTTN